MRTRWSSTDGRREADGGHSGVSRRQVTAGLPARWPHVRSPTSFTQQVSDCRLVSHTERRAFLTPPPSFSPINPNSGLSPVWYVWLLCRDGLLGTIGGGSSSCSRRLSPCAAKPWAGLRHAVPVAVLRSSQTRPGVSPTP